MTTNLTKKLISIEANLETIKTGTKKLLLEAESCFRKIDNQVANIRAAYNSLPADVKEQSLNTTLGNLERKKLFTDEFNKEAEKIRKSLSELAKNLEEVDRTWKNQTNSTRTDILRLNSIAKEYVLLIGFGGSNIASADFIKKINDFVKKTDSVRQEVLANITKRSQELIGLFKDAGYAGDPVNVCTGNFIYQKSDLTVPGAFPLAFTRFYNAIDINTGALGRNWRHSFEVTLITEDNGDVSIFFDDGHLEYYTYTEGGYQSPRGNHNLLEDVDGTARLTFKDKTVYTFTEYGSLASVADTNQNITTLTYDENGCLSSVANRSSTLTFESNDSGLIEKVTDQSGRSVVYDYDGLLLVCVTDVRGSTTRYGYDASERLESITNTDGIEVLANSYDPDFKTTHQTFFDGGILSFAYDEDKRQTTLVEQNGNEVTYHYDERMRSTKTVYTDGTEIIAYDTCDNRTSFTDKNNNTTRYEHDKRGNITGITDPLGHETKIDYNDFSLPTRIVLPNDGVSVFEYDRCGNPVKATDPLGRTFAAEINALGQPVQVTLPDKSCAKLTYDEAGNIIKVIAPDGAKTQYAYDELNQVIKTIDPLGNELSFEYNDAGDITKVTNAKGDEQLFAYNKNGKVKTFSDFDGAQTVYTYNPLGKITSVENAKGQIITYTYDVMWNVEKVIFPQGAKITYRYDTLNRLKTVTDPAGAKTQYGHDPNGNITTVTDPLGNITSYAYDALNRVTAITDAKGNVTSFEYDCTGNVTKITDAADNTRTLEWDLAGQLIADSDVCGAKTIYTYSPLGKVATVTDAKNNTTSYAYHLGGNLRSITDAADNNQLFEYDKNSNLITCTNELGDTTCYEYDCLGQVASIIAPDKTKRTFTYDAVGNVASTTDENNNTTRYEYDTSGNLIEVIDAMGTPTRYTHDFFGNLETVTTFAQLDDDWQAAQVTTYKRDKRALVTNQIDPVGQAVTYTYDAAGNVTSKTERDGTVTHLAYDSLSQLIDISYADGRTVAYSYNTLRQLTRINDWTGITTITPDVQGRALKVTDPDDKTISYTYNELGQRTSITYPDNSTVSYEHDALGRLSSVIDAQGNKTSYTYNAIGQMTCRLLPNKTRTDYAFDTSSRLSQMTSRSGDQVFDSFAYSYDPVGNMVRITKDRYDLPQDSGTFTYSYDPLGRLTEATHGDKTKTYTYDLLGNRLSQAQDGQATNYTYNELNQLIRTDMPNQSKHYEYDRRGNLAKVLADNQIDATYTFDTQGMLSQAITPKGQIEHLYNALGKRTSSATTGTDKLNPASRIDYLLDLTRPYNDLLATTQDNMTQNFLWGQGLIAATIKDTSSYYLHDHLGSPTRMLDDSGNTTARLAFDEFGVPIIDPALALDGSTGAIHNSFGFTGYQSDNITDLYFAQARYYDAGIGRFTGEDLLKGYAILPKSLNVYAYCWNDPLGLVDLDGMAPSVVDAARIAEHIYSAEKVNTKVEGTAGWKLEEIVHTPSSISNMKMGLYSREISGTTEYVLVGTGTTWHSNLDWANNVAGLTGNSYDSYKSMSIALQYSNRFGTQYELTMVGHSKAGAEATLNGVVTGRNVMTFNTMSPDLSRYGLDQRPYFGNMTHYVVEGDILNRYFDVPSIGNVEYLNRQYGSWKTEGAKPGSMFFYANTAFGVQNHLMSGVLGALDEMIAQGYEGCSW